jgi:cytochrome c-type biogenesis protein CcmE
MRLALVIALMAAACKGEPAPSVGSPDDGVVHKKFVDELVPNDHDRELRVAGTVEGPLTATGSGAERTISFGLVHNGKHLRVIHTGVLPVLFREHVDAAAQGRWRDDVFEAREVFVYAPDF